MQAWILAVLVSLAPARSRVDHAQLAQAIAAVTRDRAEAAALASVEFHETSLDVRAQYPFGLTCCVHPGAPMTLDHAAALALQILRAGERQCGNLHGAFWYFNTGDCPTPRPPDRRHRTARQRWFRGREYAAKLMRTTLRVQRSETRRARR